MGIFTKLTFAVKDDTFIAATDALWAQTVIVTSDEDSERQRENSKIFFLGLKDYERMVPLGDSYERELLNKTRDLDLQANLRSYRQEILQNLRDSLLRLFKSNDPSMRNLYHSNLLVQKVMLQIPFIFDKGSTEIQDLGYYRCDAEGRELYPMINEHDPKKWKGRNVASLISHCSCGSKLGRIDPATNIYYCFRCGAVSTTNIT